MRYFIAVFVVSIFAGCTDVGSFSTEPGECYRGGIVEAGFVRRCFESGTRLSLTLDVNRLAEGTGEAGRLWTSDGRFNGSPLSQMGEIAHDSLSLFQFPGGRIRNYLLYVVPDEGSPAMVVVSLMENEEVEVRVIRPSMSVDGQSMDECVSTDTTHPLFGIFRLKLEGQCDISLN